MTDYLQELYAMCTEIVIKPYNSNIPSAVVVSAGVAIKIKSGRYQYAKLSWEDKTVKDAVFNLTRLATALKEATEEECVTCGDSTCDNPLPCQTGDGV